MLGLSQLSRPPMYTLKSEGENFIPLGFTSVSSLILVGPEVLDIYSEYKTPSEPKYSSAEILSTPETKSGKCRAYLSVSPFSHYPTGNPQIILAYKRLLRIYDDSKLVAEFSAPNIAVAYGETPTDCEIIVMLRDEYETWKDYGKESHRGLLIERRRELERNAYSKEPQAFQEYQVSHEDLWLLEKYRRATTEQQHIVNSILDVPSYCWDKSIIKAIK